MHIPSPYRYIDFFAGLRPWELCSPHIISAVEFARLHVVNMGTMAFDEWLYAKLQQTPQVPLTGKDKYFEP